MGKEVNAATAAMLAQYETNSKKPTNSNRAEFDINNYFNTYLEDGVDTATRYVRILPAPDGGTPFKEQYVHSKQIDGKWRKFTCLKHNDDKPCPFCEAREALLAEGKDSSKKLAKDFLSRRTYVAKLIDRDDEGHGPKFWRFNHDYRGTGVLDKIIAIIRQKGDISDIEKGRDLIINIARDQNNRPVIVSILFDDETPLSKDNEVKDKWVADKRTWRDVYATKPYEFLEILVKGGEPMWDKENGKWADKLEMSADVEPITMGEALPLSKDEVAKAREAAKPTNAEVTSTPATDDDEDDLPF